MEIICKMRIWGPGPSLAGQGVLLAAQAWSCAERSLFDTFWVFQCVSMCFIGFWSIHHINSTTLGHRFHLGLKKVGWSIPIFPITVRLPCAIYPFFWAKRKNCIKMLVILYPAINPINKKTCHLPLELFNPHHIVAGYIYMCVCIPSHPVYI